MTNWPEPNYVDPVTHGQGIIITNIVFGALILITISLRVYSRLRINATFGLDDVFILFAAVITLAMYVVMSIASAKYGWDRHLWDVPESELPTTKKLNLTFQVAFALSSGLTKLSLLYFCRRLFGNAGKLAFNFHYLILIGTTFMVTGCLIGFVLILVLQCRPLKAYWDIDPTYPHSCIDGSDFIFSASILNTVTDFLCTLLPMALVWKLHMRTRQKIAVAYLFGLGILINIAGAVRTYFYHRSMYTANGDVTWAGYPTYICSSIEIGLGLIVTSAPALRPLITHFLPRLLSETSYGRGTAQGIHLNLRSITRENTTRGLHSRTATNSEEQNLPLTDTQQFKSTRGLGEIRVTQTVELSAFYRPL